MDPSLRRTFLLLIALGSILEPTQSEANTLSKSTVIGPPGAPRSEFIDNIEFGKDPFFPNSTRRPKVIVKATDIEAPRPNVPDFIVLKGISVLKDKKLAIINNYTLSEGEEYVLKTGGQPLKIKCLEIKEKSAVVSVNGATKELPLPSGY